MLAPLKSKKKIELLFRLGKKKGSGFFECRYLSYSEDDGSLLFAVVAPKKNLPRAVDRNKIKRRIRVALHKEKDLLADSGFNRFLFIYLKEEVFSFGIVQKELAKLIRSL